MQQFERNSIIAPSIAIIGKMKFRLLRSILVAGVLIVTFSGCVYRQDIPQGNRIDAELVDQTPDVQTNEDLDAESVFKNFGSLGGDTAEGEGGDSNNA